MRLSLSKDLRVCLACILIASLTLFGDSSLRAQWDFVTQPMMPSENGTVLSHAANDYGHFIATATQVQLIGNDGKLVAQISGLSSTANVCVVTGVDSPFGIITAQGSQFQIRYTTPLKQYARMAHKNVLTGQLPPVVFPNNINIVPNTGNIDRLEAVLCNQGSRLTVVWHTDQNRLGFAQFIVSDNQATIVRPPQNVLTPGGLPAIGGMPSVATSPNRQSDVHVGYANDIGPVFGQITEPVHFRIPVDLNTLPVATALVPAPAGEKVLWVAVVKFETALGLHTPHFFYGTTLMPVASSNRLYTTNGAWIDMSINPITTQLEFQPSATLSAIPCRTENDGLAPIC